MFCPFFILANARTNVWRVLDLLVDAGEEAAGGEEAAAVSVVAAAAAAGFLWKTSSVTSVTRRGIF